MPTAVEIERLEALVARLVPLSSKERGELVASDDWNTIVGALIEVGRATLGAGDGAVAPHDHPDQVTIGWLDPRLREIITGGGLKDPAVELAFAQLRRDLAALAARVDGVGADVSRARGRLDEVVTNDIVRASAVARLDRKLLGADDGRADIADLRSTLGSLEKEVARAVHVGTLLERDGETVDVAGLADRVSAVEKLRDALVWPDGSALDGGSLEVRLLDLQGSLVTQDDLTEAIKDVRTDGGGGAFDLDAVLTDARAAAREAATSATEALASDLRAEVAGRLGDVDAKVDDAVRTATDGLRESVLEEARAGLDDAVSGGDARVREDLTGLLESRLKESEGGLSERLGTFEQGLDERIKEQVAGQVGGSLDGALADLEGRLGSLSDAVERLGARGLEVDGALKDLTTSLAQARREDAADRAAIRVELATAIKGVEDRIPQRVTTAIDEARAALRTDLDASLNAATKDLQERLTLAAREAAATEVKVLSASVRTDLQAVVKQEVEAGLADVRTRLAADVTALQPSIAGMVANEVARANADLPRLVSEEVAAFQPQLERIITNRIGGTVVTPITPTRPIG